jgi:hypothetical protein
MGICQSNNTSSSKTAINNNQNSQFGESNKVTKIFSITQNGKIVPSENLKEKLYFHVNILNFRLRNMKEGYKYFITLDFPFYKDKFILKISHGPLAKFTFNEKFHISVPFEKLEDSFLKVVS